MTNCEIEMNISAVFRRLDTCKAVSFLWKSDLECKIVGAIIIRDANEICRLVTHNYGI
jgi:hypothetical protein